ncbi:hypothetical protein BC829DRAFT_397962 [Chytridium lagenaria]|nr:hypothetical protein BC829DRAFT_397962 [Chytridium lagenaria]
MFSFTDPHPPRDAHLSPSTSPQPSSTGIWGFLRKVRGYSPSSSQHSIAPSPEPVEKVDEVMEIAEDPVSSLKKIRRLRASGGGVSKEYWMSDSQVKECYECGLPFTAFKRKHHCRICGQIFCHKCASSTVPGDRFGHAGDMRLLDSYQRDDVPRPLPDKRAFVKDTPKVEEEVVFEEERGEEVAFLQGSPFRGRGDERMDVDSSEYMTEDEPVVVSLESESRMEVGERKSVTRRAQERQRRRNIRVGHPRPSKYSARAINRQMSIRTMSEVVEEKVEEKKEVGFDGYARGYLRRMLRQLLEEFEVEGSSVLEDVVMGLVVKAATHVVLDVKHGDEMDIGHYIKIKKIPGGVPTDSEYIHGIVCSKNVAHKRMLRPVHQPKILLLTFPIEYQRVENIFLSLDPVIAQEREHIKNLTSRILALEPTVVIVEKTVSRIALDFFLDANVVVIHNVKASVIEAIARCTKGDIIASIDRLAMEPRLGRCERFQVKFFDNRWIEGGRRAFLYFEGCERELGCTMVIRGGTREMLGKVKQIVSLLVFVAYNLRLEAGVLRDEMAEVGEEEAVKENGEGSGEDSGVERAIRLFERTLLSASARVKFPPPYLLLRLREQSAVMDVRRKKEGDDDKKEMKHKDAEETPKSAHSPTEATPLDPRISINQLLENAETLTPFNHQNLMFLFSSICTETLMPCEAPENHVIDTPMLKHFRSYAHNQGRVNVVIEEFDSPDEGISMWSYCKICKLRTPSIPMSEETWKYSFGKYLEMMFYCEETRSAGLVGCVHDVHRQHVRFFGVRNFTVRFEYETIDLLEISVPSVRIRANEEMQMKMKGQEYDRVKSLVTRFYDSILERVKVFAYDVIPPPKVAQFREQMTELARRASAEKKFLLQMLQHTMIVSPPSDIICLNGVLKTLHEKAPLWEPDFSRVLRDCMPVDAQRFTVQIRKMLTDKETSSTTGSLVIPPPPALFDPVASEVRNAIPSATALLKADAYLEEDSDSVFSRKYTSSGIVGSFESYSRSPFAYAESFRDRTPLDFVRSHRLHEVLHDDDGTSTTFSCISNRDLDHARDESRDHSVPAPASSLLEPESPLSEALNTSSSPVSNASPIDTSTVAPITGSIDHPPFGSLSNSVASVSSLTTTGTAGSPSILSAIAHHPTPHPFLPSISPSPVPDTPSPTPILLSTGTGSPRRQPSNTSTTTRSERKSSIPNSLVSLNFSSMVSTMTEKHERRNEGRDRVSEWNEVSGVSSSEAERGMEDELFGDIENIAGLVPGERTSIMKTLSSLWNGTAVNLHPLEYPMASADHFFTESPIIVREDEPSSIVALMLSSPQYKERLAAMQSTYANERDSASIEASAFENDDVAGDIEETLLRPGNHFKFQFIQGQTKIECKTFYAEQFDALRRNCGFQDQYVQSLSRCAKWEASGGKSGSIFMKTKDDRLILKQLSRQEMDALLKFALNYFTYVSEAFFHKLPTVLAKIFGFYRIGYKNPATGKSFRMDVVVMENLFYDRKISRIFDLKGSMRNRHIQSTGRQNEVLLDENLVEYICESPLFIREHSKVLLRASVYNDTLFLAKLNVMDYSLLVGIDEEKRELVVGIVDFIRTFTWDKKLESWVKENAFLGGGGREPTILSPRQYKTRFRESMERYFLCPPTKYHTIT